MQIENEQINLILSDFRDIEQSVFLMLEKSEGRIDSTNTILNGLVSVVRDLNNLYKSQLVALIKSRDAKDKDIRTKDRIIYEKDAIIAKKDDQICELLNSKERLLHIIDTFASSSASKGINVHTDVR